MRHSPLAMVVPVLMIVSGLATIGVAGYLMKLEWWSSPAPQQAIRPLPTDLSKLTAEERTSLVKSLQDQIASNQEAYRIEVEFRNKKKAVNLILIAISIMAAILSLIYLYLQRRNKREGQTTDGTF